MKKMFFLLFVPFILLGCSKEVAPSPIPNEEPLSQTAVTKEKTKEVSEKVETKLSDAKKNVADVKQLESETAEIEKLNKDMLEYEKMEQELKEIDALSAN